MSAVCYFVLELMKRMSGSSRLTQAATISQSSPPKALEIKHRV